MAISALTGCKVRHELAVGSKSLYDTDTTLHLNEDYRLRMIVQRIRNSFESGDLEILRWIPGPQNIADALTKRNLSLLKKLNDLCTTGVFEIDYRHSMAQGNHLWK